MTDTTIQLDDALANRSEWKTDRCMVGRSMEVVGTRSALLLMREAYWGTTRFADFAERVGITEAVAAARLRELVETGLLDTRPYQEPGQRTRQEYVLTEMGRDFLPVVLSLMQWGDKYLAGPNGSPLGLEHIDCGARIGVRVACADGHDVEAGQMKLRRLPRSERVAVMSA